jgi:DNA polymerase II large subunit
VAECRTRCIAVVRRERTKVHNGSLLSMAADALRRLQSGDNSHISICDNEISSNYLAAANCATLYSETWGVHTTRAYAARFNYQCDGGADGGLNQYLSTN